MVKGCRRREVLNPNLFGQERCFQRTSRISYIRHLAFFKASCYVAVSAFSREGKIGLWEFVKSLRPKTHFILDRYGYSSSNGKSLRNTFRGKLRLRHCVVHLRQKIWVTMAFASARCYLSYFLPINDYPRTPASDAITQQNRLPNPDTLGTDNSFNAQS